MNNYKLSTDYAALYDLVSQGQIMVGFAKYSESRLRDVVKITVRGSRSDGYIIGCRGVEYNGITRDRKDWFIEACKEINLEWIEP